MELRQLRHLLAVIEHGSINRAAAALHMTQPALSYSIRALERGVGAELLARGGGGVRLTRIGEEFVVYAQNITREAEKALGAVAGLRGAGAGRISLGVMSVFANSLAPAAIARFMSERGEVPVELTVFMANSDDISLRLRRAEWDIAVTLVADGGYATDIGITSIGRTESGVYCASSHPLAGSRHVDGEDLVRYGWAITNVGLAEQIFAEAFAEQAAQPVVRLRTNSIEAVRSLVIEHPLLCLLPTEAAAGDVRAGRLVELPQHLIRRVTEIGILHSNLTERTPETRALIAAFARCAAED